MSATKRLLVCLAVLVAIPFVAVAVILAPVLWNSYRHTAFRERVRFAVPGTSFVVEHSRIGTHPMMAEYDRDIAIVLGGRVSHILPMAPDTCGGYPINCYLIKTPIRDFLRLEDAVTPFRLLVDLKGQSVYQIDGGLAKPYHGGFGDAGSRASGAAVSRSLSKLLAGGTEQYAGRIDGGLGELRFTPAAEAPEIPIDHSWN